MVKMLDQLAKLGVFKSKPKKRKSSKSASNIRQDNDMVGSVKTLEGEPGRGDSNLFALRQIEPGMSEQEIEDIQERNNAGIATLREEVQKQRLADIEQQQGQRFADITRLGGIMNPILERFRSAQEPGAGVYNPFTEQRTIFLPDIQEETFTQTLNEGGPGAEPAIQSELFAESGEEEAGISMPRIQPIQKIQRGKPTRNEYLRLNGLGPLPPKTKNTTLQTMRDYYDDFSQALGIDADESLFQNKVGMYKDMVQKIDDLINLSID
jgi:hypothetical protein